MTDELDDLFAMLPGQAYFFYHSGRLVSSWAQQDDYLVCLPDFVPGFSLPAVLGGSFH
jgi:hypothetical protein